MDSPQPNYPESRLEPYLVPHAGQSAEAWLIASEIHQTITDIQDATAQRDYFAHVQNTPAALVLDEHLDYLLFYLEKLRKGQLDELETD
jgi:hypothetical protein